MIPVVMLLLFSSIVIADNLKLSTVLSDIDVTILGGVSKFTPQHDGIWYQDPFPHQLNMISPSYGFRVDGKKNSDDWSFGIGYMNLGKVTSSAKAVALDGMVPGDGGYNASTKSCNGPCWPLSQWNGSGNVQGVFGAATKHYGPFALEAGVYIYKPTWKVNIPDWIACATCATQNISVHHNAKWQVGPMFGAKYEFNDKWSLNASMWHTASEGDEWSSLYHNMTYNMSIGYKF